MVYKAGPSNRFCIEVKDSSYTFHGHKCLHVLIYIITTTLVGNDSHTRISNDDCYNVSVQVKCIYRLDTVLANPQLCEVLGWVQIRMFTFTDSKKQSWKLRKLHNFSLYTDEALLHKSGDPLGSLLEGGKKLCIQFMSRLHFWEDSRVWLEPIDLHQICHVSVSPNPEVSMRKIHVWQRPLLLHSLATDKVNTAMRCKSGIIISSRAALSITKIFKC